VHDDLLLVNPTEKSPKQYFLGENDSLHIKPTLQGS